MSSPKLPLPWQQEQWSHLCRLRQAGRLPHALLLAGPAGVGKRHFADLLGNSLLCTEPDAEGFACGHCRNCQLLAAGSHPDRLRVEPDGAARQIRIDAVRAILDFNAQTASRGSGKLIVLAPAESMNRNAANALLKCLEEPAPDTLILLLSDQPGALPATIRSRCQRIPFPVPPEVQVRRWLQTLEPVPEVLEEALREAAGRPLTARALLDPEWAQRRRAWREQLLALVEGRKHAVAVAAAWQDTPLEELLEWLEARLADAVRAALAPSLSPGDVLTSALAARGAAPLLRWRDRVLETRGRLNGGANFSRPLVLEELLL